MSVALLVGLVACGQDSIASLPEGTLFTSVTVGAFHSCALDQNSIAYCWGSNTSGQLGIESERSRTPVPTPVAGGPVFRALDAGRAHTCGVTLLDEIWCWGANGDGQLGDGTHESRDAPVELQSGGRFALVSAGVGHTCALDYQGRASCWGRNNRGQLGTGTTVSQVRPTGVVGDQRFSSISSGALHTCAVSVGAVAYCWGDNEAGQLGTGAPSGHSRPVPLDAAQHTFRSVTAGFSHTCGLTRVGEALCWGSDDRGELGNGETGDRRTPSPVSGGHFFSEVVTGTSPWSCGILRAGEVHCWGTNGSGIFGAERLVALEPLPATAKTGGEWQGLAVGDGHLCAVEDDGIAYCWGSGGSGQLGDGASSDSDVPVPVQGL